jgi:hypothetical protein
MTTQKYKPKFREILDNLETRVFGNRVTVVGASLALGFVAKNNIFLGPETIDWSHFLYELSLGMAGTLLCARTRLGIGTYRTYRRVKEHIKKHGKPDPRFLRKAMALDIYPYPFTGYCQIQGTYLACRNTGFLEDFYKLREESKNLMPNF